MLPPEIWMIILRYSDGYTRSQFEVVSIQYMKMAISININTDCPEKIREVKLIKFDSESLLWCCLYNQNDFIKHYFNKGLHLSWHSAMDFVCRNGNIDIVKSILEYSASNHNIKSRLGFHISKYQFDDYIRIAILHDNTNIINMLRSFRLKL